MRLCTSILPPLYPGPGRLAALAVVSILLKKLIASVTGEGEVWEADLTCIGNVTEAARRVARSSSKLVFL